MQKYEDFFFFNYIIKCLKFCLPSVPPLQMLELK